MEIYTPIEEAGDIIRRRWEDKKLRKAVEGKLKGDIPEILQDGPSGMIWRQICTPDGEFERFFELCKKAKVKPACLEYAHDKFAARNFTKYELTRLPFKIGKTAKLKTIVEKEKIIDFKDAEKKKMYELKTLWGENLVDFHHFILKKMFPEISTRIADISDWVVRNGGHPQSYYFNILSFAICHVILFDDFDSLKSEQGFMNEIVLPAFEEVQKYFGVKPVIVKISNVGEQEKDPNWCGYSAEVKKNMDEHIKTLSNI